VRGELDWIVMKALEKDRNRRYETAASLARDLGRYLDDQPVLAGPPSAGYRLRKFLRRNQGPVWAATLVLATLTAGAVVSTWQAVRATLAERQARAALKAEQASREAEAAQRQHAEANLQLACDAVDQMLAEVGQTWLANVPQMGPLRRKLLEKALRFHQGFLRDKGTDPAVRLRAAEAQGNVARIHHLMGQFELARQDCDRAVDGFGELAAEFPAEPKYARLLARYVTLSGSVRKELGQFRKAVDAYRRALTLLEQLVADHPLVTPYRVELANTHVNLGALLRRMGQLQGAETAYRQALAIEEEQVARTPQDAESRRLLARIHNNLANLLKVTGRCDEAESAYRRALVLQESLAAEFPEKDGYQVELARTGYNLGNMHLQMGRHQEAEAAYRHALALQERVVSRTPVEPACRLELTRTCSNLSQLLHQVGRPKEGEPLARRGVAHGEEQIANFPGVAEYREDLAMSIHTLARLVQDLGRPLEAEPLFRRCLALQEALLAGQPNLPDYASDLACSLSSLAGLLNHRGDGTSALPMVRRAIDLQRQALQSNPQHPARREFLGEHYATLALTFVTLGHHAEAAQAVAESVRSDPNGWRGHQSAAGLLARCIPLAEADSALPQARRNAVARAYLDESRRHLTEAVAHASDPKALDRIAWSLVVGPCRRLGDWPRAVALARQATEREPATGTHWITLGLAQYRAAKTTAAQEALEHARRLLGDGNARLWLGRAMVHCRLGQSDQARACYERALRVAGDLENHDEDLRTLRDEVAALLGACDSRR
jgi:tetratricopeptide (TPR) repeat protein